MILFYSTTNVNSTGYGQVSVLDSEFNDLESELDSNVQIKDTLGGLPSRFNTSARTCGDFKNGFTDATQAVLPPNTQYCAIQYNTYFNNGTYYIGILGPDVGYMDYNLRVYKGRVSIAGLNTFGTPLPVLRARRPTISTGVTENELLRPFNYRYYEINVDPSTFKEQSYLTVNISRAQPYYDDFPVLRLHYLRLPQSVYDEGAQTTTNDPNEPLPYYQWCVDLNNRALPYNLHPTNRAPSKTCQCIPDVYVYEDGATQMTCNVTVDPCFFQYGKWYASVELPPRTSNTDPFDVTGFLNYTIFAVVDSPDITTLRRNVTSKGLVIPEEATHYKIQASNFEVGATHLFVQLSNVRGATVDAWVHQGLGPTRNIAGGPEACVSANATCRTCDACNIVIEKCYFVPGEWYISVNIVYDDAENRFMVEDVNRLPATFTIRANWRSDPQVQSLLAGVPVYKSIGENLYDFYVVDIPPTVDTWLFVELYTQANDTEVILSMLHGAIPGGECYERPDFYCMTGDSRGATYETGRPQDVAVAPPVRESCTFMIQTCELEAGLLYLSVYGHRLDYGANRGDNTFYQIPVEYTLWVDFDVALSLESSLSYTEHVFERQYNHYYIRADNVDQGSQLVVEATNIQHGIPPTIEVFVNYNFLAGNCPCYDHLFNCSMGYASGCNKCDQKNGPPNNYVPSIESPATPAYPVETVSHCCTIVVPPCDFRPGVWYIGVLGVNEDLDTYTTAIGYTLTATIIPPPAVEGLLVGQAATGSVPMFNRTYEYDHYKLAAEPIPLHNLVFELVYNQNCEYEPKHDNLRDVLTLYINTANIATQECYQYTCNAELLGQSYCTIVIPFCEWSNMEENSWIENLDYFVSIQGNYDARFEARYTLRTSVEPVQETKLTDGVAVHGSVKVGRYEHYAIDVTATGAQNMWVNFFTNADQDRVTLFLNTNTMAGLAPCFSYMTPYQCEDVSCQWLIPACKLPSSRYYLSVFGGTSFQKQFFYNIPVDYTLVVSLNSVVTTLTSGNPVMGNAYVGQLQHYAIVVGTPEIGTFLQFEVDNVRHGSVVAYINYANTDDDDNDLAGPCPCYKFNEFCLASGTTCDQDRVDDEERVGSALLPNWCQLRVSPCKLRSGTYHFSVAATQYATPVPFSTTPVGYTAEAALVANPVRAPKVERDRQLSNQLAFEFVQNARYNHYVFDTDDDDTGFNIIVEITDIREGALFAYYRNGDVSDQDPSCQLARICAENGLYRGTTCNWQLPYCLTSKGTHYVSIEGATGRAQTIYDILIWKQRPLEVLTNPFFDVNNITTSANSTQEVNVVHDYRNEPNGWTQFIRLEDVQITTPDEEDGNVLEVFFYRMQNNAGVPIKFNAYLQKGQPAGPGTCCSDDISDPFVLPRTSPLTPDTVGSCQGFPCLDHVDTTAHVLPIVSEDTDSTVSFTCDAGFGVGAVGAAADLLSPCVLTVWACDLAEIIGDDDVEDWWLTVIPDSTAIDPTPTLPTLPGLTYTVAWKMTNIRTDVARATPATTDLTSFVNAGPVTYLVGSNPEEYTSFSFDVDLEGDMAYLSVRAQSNGTAYVYINFDGFAGPGEDCSDFTCNAQGEGACDDDDSAYILQPCCTESGRYWITVRHGPEVDTPVEITFVIAVQVHSTSVDIPTVPTRTSPFNATGAAIAPGNTVSYRLSLSEDDLNDHQRLFARLAMNNATQPQRYNLGIRRGFEANSNNDECFIAQYDCQTNNNDDSPVADCELLLEACNMLPGDWYFTVDNGVLDVQGGSLPSEGYSIEIFLDEPPEALDPNFPQSGVLTTRVGTDLMSTMFRTNLDSNELQWGHRSPLLGYYTRYVQWQYHIDWNATLGSVQAVSPLLSFDDTTGCVGQYATSSCNAVEVIGGRSFQTCYANVAPCTDFYDDDEKNMNTGDYFWELRVQVDDVVEDGLFEFGMNYTAEVAILTSDYLEIVPIVEDHPRGDDVSNLVFDVNGFFTTNNTEFRYAFDTADYPSDFVSADDDDLAATNFMVGYLNYDTTIVGDNGVNFEVWRDDCTRFECATTSTKDQTENCVIDALTLAPCSVKGGRYYFRVFLTDAAAATITDLDSVDFNFQWHWNQTHTDTLELDIVHNDQIIADEYHELFIETDRTDLPSTLTVDITSESRTVEAWINVDKQAGPGPDATNCLTSCNLDYVLTTVSEDDAGLWVGQLFVDTRYVPRGARGFWIAIRGVRQAITDPPSPIQPPYTTQISYSVKVVQRPLLVTPIPSSACLTINRLVAPLAQVPRQYVTEITALPAGSLLRFSVQVPPQAAISGADVVMTVSYGNPVPYAVDPVNGVPNPYAIDETFTCSLTIDGDYTADSRTCTRTLDSCDSRQGTYYISVDGPRGTQIVVDKWSPVVQRILDNVVVSGTVNHYPGGLSFGSENSALNFGKNFMPPFQVYRIPINANRRDFLVRAHLYGVQSNDQLDMWLNYGEAPASTPTTSTDCSSVPKSCSVNARLAITDRNCTLFLGQEYFGDLYKNTDPNPNEQQLPFEECTTADPPTPLCDAPKKLWLVVKGETQGCELHAASYKLHVETSQSSKKMIVSEAFCDSVEENQQNAYRLFPKFTPLPQETILRVEVLNVPAASQVQLGISDGRVPSPYDTDVSVLSDDLTHDAFAPYSLSYGSATIESVCAYGLQQNNLYWEDEDSSSNDDEGLYIQILGVRGPDDDDNDDDDDDEDEKLLPKAINYCLNATIMAVNVIELTDDVRLEMDDDDDACPGVDYFRISSTDSVNGYMELSIISEGNFEVITNIGGLAGAGCSLDSFSRVGSNGDEAERIWRDFCRYSPNQVYYFTVSTSAKYSIMARTVDDVTHVEVGDSLDDVVRDDQLKTYEIRIRDIEPDSRLVINIEDVFFSSVAVWVRRAGFTGPVLTNEDGTPLEFSTECQIKVNTPGETGFPADTTIIAGIESGAADSSAQSPTTYGYGYVTIPATCLSEGSYFVTITGWDESDDDCRSARFTIRPEIIELNVALEILASGTTVTDEGLDLYQVGRYDSVTDLPRHRFYRIETTGTFGKANLFQVDGGQLRMDVKADHLAFPPAGDSSNLPAERAWGLFFSGQRTGLQSLVQQMAQGTRPFSPQQVLDSALWQTNRASEESCTTDCTRSCVIWVDECDYAIENSAFYLVVSPHAQDYLDNHVSYSIRFEDYESAQLLAPGNPIVETSINARDHRFYKIVQTQAESLRIEVVVESGDDGVHVQVRNNFCDHTPDLVGDWEREFYCDRATAEDGFACQFELPARADHPGCSTFYVITSSWDANYTINYLEGRENCNSFTGKGISEGLDFCRGLPYSTWRLQDYSAADQEAECLFTQLYEQFRVQPCWSGVTPECNDTLQRFACYETFRRCDDRGFIVGTCEEACESVVYECVNWFESVDLEHYNCSSSRYIPADQDTCTGNKEYHVWGQSDLDFNVDDILYKSAPAPSTSSDDDSSRSTSSSTTVTISWATVVAFLTVSLFL